MSRRLEGKFAIVTGGGRGIGRAICLKFAQEGANVAVWDIDPKTAASVAGEVRGLGVKAKDYQVDITDYPGVKLSAQEVITDFGRLDILVNNAGWDKIEPFVKSEEATWDRILAINLRGPITLARAVLDHMIERNYGKIVNVASDAGRVGSLGETVYAAAKAGQIGFTKSLAREMIRKGINVNCVCPGLTDTPLVKEMMEYAPKVLGGMEKVIPFGRMAKPEEIAAAVAFLASDEAEFIVGQTLSVSGGLTMA